MQKRLGVTSGLVLGKFALWQCCARYLGGSWFVWFGGMRVVEFGDCLL